jgi:hypothetical protein
MTTAEKCEAILRRIVAICNDKQRIELAASKGGPIGFETSDGWNCVVGSGPPETHWENFVDGMLKALHTCVDIDADFDGDDEDSPEGEDDEP